MGNNTFVDTNYFLRFLIGDISSQHEKAKKLFEDGLNGKKKLVTSVIVFFEIFWVFSSFYEKSKKEVVAILESVLRMDFIDFENKKVLKESLKEYKKSSLELEDCYNIEISKVLDCSNWATFDKKVLKNLGS